MTTPYQEQLTLGIRFRDDCDFSGFFVGENIQAVEALKQLSGKNPAESYLFIWGLEGSGCSHLLQAVCQQAAQEQLTCAYLPMSELKDYVPVLLEGMEKLDVICVDNIEVIADKPDWQEGFFHLFNRLSTRQGRILISADQAPRYLPIALADLNSRLCQGVVFHIKPLTEEEKMLAFMRRAKKRGLLVSEEVMQFILNRCPRDTRTLFALLEKLDRRSLQAGRRLTIPFVKEVMGW